MTERTILAADIKRINQCPCCGADDLSWGTLEFESDAVLQEWFCGVCEAEGHDWYDLTNRVITKEGERS